MKFEEELIIDILSFITVSVMICWFGNSSLFGIWLLTILISLMFTVVFAFMVYSDKLISYEGGLKWLLTFLLVLSLLFFVVPLGEWAIANKSQLDEENQKTFSEMFPMVTLFGGYLGGRLFHYAKPYILNNHKISSNWVVAKVLSCTQQQTNNSSILEFELDFSEGEGNRKQELIKLNTRYLDPEIQKINPQNFKDKMIIAMPKSENCEGVIMTVTNDGKLKLLSVTKGAKPGDKVG